MSQAISQPINGNYLNLHISTNPKVQTRVPSRIFIDSSCIMKCSCNLTYHVVQAMKNNSVKETQSSNNISYWASINDEIEDYLKEAIPHREPFCVFEPMHHLTFDGPKTMAPALCVAACELVGGHRAQALPAASALQVMHAAVQAHDYLPLTDNPRPKTRCRPINHVFQSNVELLTGDGLLSFGYELLAGLDDPNKPKNSGRILQVIIEVTRAMGSRGMVEGQYTEVEYGHLDELRQCQEGWLKHMYEKKEGVLHACGAACGAILGEANEEQTEKLRNYGLYVGVIQGMLHDERNTNKEVIEMIQRLRELALKELEIFSPENVEVISSFVNVWS